MFVAAAIKQISKGPPYSKSRRQNCTAKNADSMLLCGALESHQDESCKLICYPTRCRASQYAWVYLRPSPGIAASICLTRTLGVRLLGSMRSLVMGETPPLRFSQSRRAARSYCNVIFCQLSGRLQRNERNSNCRCS